MEILKNREKAMVIDALRSKYSLKNLLAAMNMAKSSYCYQRLAISYDKYSETRLKNQGDIQRESQELRIQTNSS